MSLSVEENRKIWLKLSDEDRELLNGRVKEDIEKYRKGYCKLQVVDENGKPLAGKKVTVNQTRHDFRYGANIFMLDEFGDEALNKRYRESYCKYFNAATVPFYWDGLEPECGKPRYDKQSPKVYRRPAPELCVEYCEENNVAPKLHCLIYDKFTPDWLPKRDMQKMESFYEERFRQIAERYSDRLFEIEVENELLCEHGWETQTVISKKKDIVEWGFALARKYFPGETLVLNEGNPICDMALKNYRNSYYMLIENALLKGVSIDKIGLQHHCFTGAATRNDEEYEKEVKRGSDMFSPSKILRGLDIAASFGLPLEITEITVPTFGETAEDEELQADLFEQLYTLFFSHPSVDTAVYWNLPDGYAYITDENRIWNENKCLGGLFHHDMTPKKSAERLYYLFNEKWHTDLELVTDRNGYVEFKGFYGEYNIEIDGKKEKFGLHKNNSRISEITI